MWIFHQEGIGLDAINDAFLLEGAIYRILRRHCRGQPYYVHLLELFTEVRLEDMHCRNMWHEFFSVINKVNEWDKLIVCQSDILVFL